MRYAEGEALGSGLANAISALANSAKTENSAYEGQQDRLAKRGELKSSMSKNLADAAYKNLQTDNMATYNTQGYVDALAELSKTDPTKAAYRTSLAGGGDWSHVGGLLNNQQDYNVQDMAIEQAKDGNLPAFNVLNLSRQPGAVAYQGFSNGTSENKVTGQLDTSLALQMQAEAEKAKGRYNPRHSSAGATKFTKTNTPFFTAKYMVPNPAKKSDGSDPGVPSFIIDQKYVPILQEIYNRYGYPPDSMEAAQMFDKMLPAPAAAPASFAPVKLSPEDERGLSGLIKTKP